MSTLKPEKAYQLGKASKYCKSILDIFETLEKITPELTDAFHAIESAIEDGINALNKEAP